MEQSISSKIIKQLRVKKAWSQEKLAVASGLSLRTIQRIENEGVCSLESKQAIAATFQVETTALDFESNEKSFIDKNMSGCKFDDVNLSGAEFVNTSLVKAVFENINLSNASFNDINLREVTITDANVRGMTVNGYLLTDLISLYEKQQS